MLALEERSSVSTVPYVIGVAFVVSAAGTFLFGWMGLLPLALLGGAAASGYLVTDWRRPLILLVCVLLLVPADLYHLSSVVPFNLELHRVVLLLMLGLWGIGLLVSNELKWQASPFDARMVWAGACVFVSLAVGASALKDNGQLSQGVKALAYFMTFGLLYAYIVTTLRGREDVDTVLTWILVVSAVVGAFGVVERYTGFNVFLHLDSFLPFLRRSAPAVDGYLVRGGIRIKGSVVHPIGFAAIMMMVLPLALYKWKTATSRHSRGLCVACAALIFAAGMLTVSRTAFASVLVAAAVVFIALPQWRKSLLICGVVAVVAMHILSPGLAGRFLETLSPGYLQRTEAGNQDGRVEDYPRIWREFARQPLFGRGYGTFDPKKFFWVDNQYLKFIVELGLVGFLGILGLFIAIFLYFWRTARVLEPPDSYLFVSLAASTAVFTVAGALFDEFGFSQVPYLFVVIFGLGTVAARSLGPSASAAREAQPDSRVQLAVKAVSPLRG